jgi:hypothetical protein
MARVRSPNYPALGLSEAIKLVTTVQAAEQHLAAPKEVVAKHLGYSGFHGKSGRVISALENYGLLEEVSGDKVRVSDLAMSILFPASEVEKQKAINEAAYRHPLFAAIRDEWQGSRPSDQNLRVYLVRRKFGSDALDRVIEVYRETMDLVTPEPGVYPAQDGGLSAKGQEAHPMHTTQSAPRTLPLATATPSVPMRVSFNGDLLEVSAVLADAGAVDRLVKALEANKSLLPLTAKPKEGAN